ncbi:MAG: colicin D domain-containing protein [Clostridia bacterium]
MFMGFDRYRFVAVMDLKASEICRQHDGLIDPDTGKPYTYANRKDGINFPPLHPWCRSCEAPVVDEYTLDGLTRPAKDPETGKIIRIPASMTDQQWHEKYVVGNPDAEFAERMTQHTSADQKQWQKYREVLGNDATKTLAEFQSMKYTDPQKWSNLESVYRDTVSVNRILLEPLNMDTEQFGKKAGKHKTDFGLDPSNATDREQIANIINNIVDNFDTVSKGAWRGQQSDVLFFAKAEDVVVTSQNKAFITILKGGITNARVKNARRISILPIL